MRTKPTTTGARAVGGGGQHEPDNAQLADRIAAAVTECPGVAGLAAGPLATYLPGRTVPGVAIREQTVAVAVVAEYGPPLTEVAQQVQAAVTRVAPGHRVDVAVDDIDLPTEARPGRSGAGTRTGS